MKYERNQNSIIGYKKLLRLKKKCHKLSFHEIVIKKHFKTL